ncbi:MAG: energy-coupling factor transporter transmembrane protein EcfT, partial [Eggerthellaceae bacterium]|nr:energy-coupling factor transporter transmembrane protein EcfT [Eggerthellaceae bacterium]
AFSKIPFKTAIKTAAPLLIVSVLTFLFNLFFNTTGEVLLSWWIVTITSDGVYAAFFFGIRLSLLIFIACLLTLTTSILKITDATEDILLPLQKIGFPTHELAVITNIAIRFLPMFAQEFVTIRQARQARGSNMSFNPFKGGLKTLGSILTTLFVSAFRHADTLSQAMDARCYHGLSRRRMGAFSWKKEDSASAVFIILLLTGCILLGLI